MKLQDQLVSIPFDYGPDEHHDARLLQLGQQSSAINVDWTREGAATKRLGYVSYGKTAYTGGNITNIALLFAWNSQLLALDGVRLKSGGGTAGKWTDVDDVSPCIGSQTPIANFSQTITSFDVCLINATAGAMLAYVWAAPDATGTSQIWLAITDAATGTTLLPPTQPGAVGGSTLPRIVPTDPGPGAAGAVITSVSGTTISALLFSVATMSLVGAGATLCTDFYASGTYDVSPTSTSNFGFVYPTSTGTVVAKFCTSTNPITVSSSITIARPATALGNAYGVAIEANAARLGTTAWVSYAYGDSALKWRMYARGLSYTNYATTTTAETQLYVSPVTQIISSAMRMSIALLSSTSAHFSMSPTYTALQDSSTTTTPFVAFATLNTSLSVSNQGQAYHWGLTSKTFVYNGRTYGLAVYAGQLPSVTTNGVSVQTRSTYCLIEFCTYLSSYYVQPRCTIAPRIAQNDVNTIATITNVVSYTPGVYTTAAGVLRSSVAKYGVSRADFDFRASAPRWQAAELGGSLYLGGGLPSTYDGALVSELGYTQLAPVYSVSTSTVGGNILAGTYQYAVCYAWYDARGQITRSAPAYSSTITTTGSTSTNTLIIGALNLTAKQKPAQGSTQVFIEVYRTVAGPGTVFYKLTSDVVPAANYNPNLSQSITITDVVADANITGNALLYTTGGVLEGQCPPSLAPFVAHGKRLVGAGDDGVTLWFSTEYDGGTSQPRFNDALTLALPDGGRITGLASQDGQLFVFKRDRIYLVTGDGPNELGQGGAWAFQRVASDVGCTQPRSIVLSPLGVFFASLGRIYLISRGAEVTYIGAPLEVTTLANQTVTSATLCTQNNTVRFTLQASDASTTGVVAVYNYLMRKWATWQFYDADLAVASTAVSSAVNVSGVYYWGTANGATYQESSTLYTDAGQYVTLSIETAWIKAGAVAGFGRFRYGIVLGEKLDAHDLALSVAVDYSPTYAQVAAFTAPVIATFTTPLELASVHIATQKSAAVRFKVSDATPTATSITTGAGPRLLGLNVLMGVYSGDYRQPPQQGN